jgi:hypothetical protein
LVHWDKRATAVWPGGASAATIMHWLLGVAPAMQRAPTSKVARA